MSGLGPIYASPVAIAIPFGPVAGFVSTDVENAIAEAQKTLTTILLQATTTVSSTSTTAAPIADMTVTPGAGRWGMFFTAGFRTTGVNTVANIAIYKNNVLVASTVRTQSDNSAILGLVTLSTNEGASSAAVSYQDTLIASDQITIQFNRGSGGTAFVDARTFLLFQTGL